MKTILVVESHSNLAALYIEELEDEGYKVLSARDVNEAVRVAEQAHPRLVVLEDQLYSSRMNGTELMGCLRNAMPNLPIVVNTSLGVGCGDRYVWANACVQKSGDLTELKARVREHCR